MPFVNMINIGTTMIPVSLILSNFKLNSIDLNLQCIKIQLYIFRKNDQKTFKVQLYKFYTSYQIITYLKKIQITSLWITLKIFEQLLYLHYYRTFVCLFLH